MNVSTRSGSLVLSVEKGDKTWVDALVKMTKQPPSWLVKQLLERAAWPSTSTFVMSGVANTVSDGNGAWLLPSVSEIVQGQLKKGRSFYTP